MIRLFYKHNHLSNKTLLAILSCTSLVITAPSITSKQQPSEWHTETRNLYYNMPVSIIYAPANRELSNQVWDYLEQIDDIFNDYKPDTEISRINARSKAGFASLSNELEQAFEKAEQAYKLSEGVFDITCAPLRKLWRDAEAKQSTPSDPEIELSASMCGFSHIKRTGSQLEIKHPETQFDFGGIIKGIATDRAIELLKKGGATNALVQVGGETAAFGRSSKGRPFRIAIQHPAFKDKKWCVIHNPNGPLSGSTSGNYENPITINGETYYHILDPRTGRPAKTTVASVSVIFGETGKNWLCDTLTTSGVLLGAEKTIPIVEKLGGEALFIILDNEGVKEIKSKGWDAYQL